jgi:hypothetical protein
MHKKRSNLFFPPLIFQKNSAEISTFSSHLKVAGLHRVCPSTTLDKSY